VGDFTRCNLYYASLKFTQPAKRKEITTDQCPDAMHVARTLLLQAGRSRRQKSAKYCGGPGCEKNVASDEIADKKVNQYPGDYRDKAEQDDNGFAGSKWANRYDCEHNREHDRNR
jgi:hypothetical protein